jgi:hypothetical protein
MSLKYRYIPTQTTIAISAPFAREEPVLLPVVVLNLASAKDKPVVKRANAMGSMFGDIVYLILENNQTQVAHTGVDSDVAGVKKRAGAS